MTEIVSMQNQPAKNLTAKDYASDQEVRWCPGCGDYAILRAMQKTLADLEAKTHETVFISGIGCSSRFPYYMATYGFHTIHGRAPALATGLKLSRPELDVWVVTGDGDGMSIGGNHMFHVLRRNVDMQILLFNNEIYGLTKGQYSPTSQPGTVSPSSPGGSQDGAANPCQFALGSGARFIARSADTLQAHMPVVLKRAKAFRGASFVEILQNCIIYNDGVFDHVTNKKTGPEHTLMLEHGKPMIFGKTTRRGLRVKPGSFELEVVNLEEDGVAESDLLVHNEHDPVLAGILARLGEGGSQAKQSEFPTVLGVLYCDPDAKPFRAEGKSAIEGESAVDNAQGFNPADHAPKDPQQIKQDISALLRRGHNWTVDAAGHHSDTHQAD